VPAGLLYTFCILNESTILHNSFIVNIDARQHLSITIVYKDGLASERKMEKE